MPTPTENEPTNLFGAALSGAFGSVCELALTLVEGESEIADSTVTLPCALTALTTEPSPMRAVSVLVRTATSIAAPTSAGSSGLLSDASDLLPVSFAHCAAANVLIGPVTCA